MTKSSSLVSGRPSCSCLVDPVGTLQGTGATWSSVWVDRLGYLYTLLHTSNRNCTLVNI